MASARVSSKCSKCKDTVGSFNCAGCKDIFCVKHSIEHRQELCNKFEQLMTEHNTTLQQMHDKKPEKELLKKNFYSQIDEWKNAMIERVCQRAEEIRQQLDEQMDSKNEMIIKDIRLLTEEIHQRHEKEDFFEHDIERIQGNIKEVQQAIEKSTRQSDIELCIEPNETVDWENLIYIQEKSNSSVTKKDKNDTRNILNSNQEYYPYRPLPPSYFLSTPVMNVPREMNSQCIPIVRPPNEWNSSANILTNRFPSPHQSLSNPYVTPTLSHSGEKRQRKPLPIIDPKSHKACEVKTSSDFTDTNQNSSQAAQVNPSSSSDSSSTIKKSQKQADFRHDFARMLNTNSNT